jgi:hypothetical protein
LYAADASIESPLVVQLLGVERGICQGHDQLRRFIGLVFQRQPTERRRYRTGFFTDGTKLMWEYPRTERLQQPGQKLRHCRFTIRAFTQSSPR